MVCDTQSSQDASTHQIWNSYLKEYRRYHRTRSGMYGPTVQLLYASQSSFGGIKREIGKAPKRQDIIPGLKIVSMIRKYHNCRQTHGTAMKSHTTTTRHQEEKTKQSNQLSLPHQDDCKTRMDIK